MNEIIKYLNENGLECNLAVFTLPTNFYGLGVVQIRFRCTYVAQTLNVLTEQVQGACGV